jgi:hypothetical protein
MADIAVVIVACVASTLYVTRPIHARPIIAEITRARRFQREGIPTGRTSFAKSKMAPTT